MFDFAWSELALIAVVALLVIGPKDLPRVMRTVATYVRKARAIAREFQGHVEDMVREAELDEVRREVQKATQLNLQDEFAKTVDPKGELQAAFADPLLTNPMAETPMADMPSLEPPQTAPQPDPLPVGETAGRIADRRDDEGSAAVPTPAASAHHSA